MDERQEQFNQKIAEHQQYWEDFIYYSKPFRVAYERCMGNERWLHYFNANHGEVMIPRYESLTKLPQNPDSIALYLNTGALPLPAPSPEGMMSQGLRLNGFGVYNCDQIRRLGKAVEVVATYTDEQGQPFEPTSLYAIDYSLNTAMSFNPRNFKVNPKSKTAVFVVDQAGKSYLVDADYMAGLDLEDKVSVHTLVARNISDKIRTTEDLRRELGLAAR